MQRSAREILTGFLTVAVLGVLAAWLTARDTHRTASDGAYRLRASFNQVDGLFPGDDVRLGGITVGVVESQHLDDAFRAVLTLRIDKDVALPSDTSVAIHTSGLFGSKFITLEPGGELDALTDGDSIFFTQDSLVVEDLLELIINEGKSRRAATTAH